MKFGYIANQIFLTSPARNATLDIVASISNEDNKVENLPTSMFLRGSWRSY